MDAREAAARFAAYTWYKEARVGQGSATEAARFARNNWTPFLPVAAEGLGFLLLRVAARQGRPPKRRRTGARPRSAAETQAEVVSCHARW